jgi:arylsulfatase A-like enzyme
MASLTMSPHIVLIMADHLRRDPLSCYGDMAVNTPNLDRLGARGTVFDHCHTGSTPCMPARRDLYTRWYESLRRGWGPLEDDDLDLPRQLSPRPTQSIQRYEEIDLCFKQ